MVKFKTGFDLKQEQIAKLLELASELSKAPANNLAVQAQLVPEAAAAIWNYVVSQVEKERWFDMFDQLGKGISKMRDRLK